MPKLSEFNVKFRKQITLRNELIPVGNTLFNIQKNKIISKDQELADKYEKAKLILDDFYRYFINTALSDIKLDWSDLADALLSNNGLKKIQSEKRKQIIDCFTKTSLEFENKFEKKEEKVKITYSDLFKGSELFKKKKMRLRA